MEILRSSCTHIFLLFFILQAFTHTDYLADFPVGEEGGVYADSSIDPAMKNAYTQTRKWMMAKYDLTEFECWTIITQAVNFGMTQLVDGNWGMHALIPKGIFEGVERKAECNVPLEEEEPLGIDEEEEIEETVDEDVVEEVEESGAGHIRSGIQLVISLGLLFVAVFN